MKRRVTLYAVFAFSISFSLPDTGILMANHLNQQIFIQEKYEWSSAESSDRIQLSYHEVRATVRKLRSRLEKYSYRKTVLMQLVQVEKVLDSLKLHFEGKDASIELPVAIENSDELRKYLVRQLYIEGTLLYEMNKNLGLSRRAKKSRFKKLLRQIRQFADAGHYIILD